MPWLWSRFISQPPQHLSATLLNVPLSTGQQCPTNPLSTSSSLYSSFVTACGLQICKWNHSIWQNLCVPDPLRHPGVVAWLPVLMAFFSMANAKSSDSALNIFSYDSKFSFSSKLVCGETLLVLSKEYKLNKMVVTVSIEALLPGRSWRFKFTRHLWPSVGV